MNSKQVGRSYKTRASRSRQTVSWVVFLLVAVSGPAGAQEPARPRINKLVELTIVNLDVVVTDAKGNRVRGLRSEDFELRERGEKIAIANFSEYREAGTAEAPSGSPDRPAASQGAVPTTPGVPSRPPRHIILFIDRLYLPERDRREALFGSIKAFLSRSLGPQDSAMLVTWHRSLRHVIPFTSDREKLRALIDEVADTSGGLLGNDTVGQLAAESAWFRSIPAVTLGPPASPLAPRLLAQEAFHEMKAKTRALNALVSALGGMEGRRVLLLASHRFSRYAGLEYYLPRRATVSDYFSQEARSFDAKSLVESVASAANTHGVSLYTLLTAGDANPDAPSAAHGAWEAPGLNAGAIGMRDQLIVNNDAEALEHLSEETGGAMAVGAASASKLLPLLGEDLESYYALGFSPSAAAVGREIEVEVKTTNKTYRVRARKAFVEKSLVEEMKDRVVASLFGKVDDTGLNFGVRAKPDSLSKRRATYDVELQIPIAQLALRQKGRAHDGAFSVFFAAASPNGDLSEVTQQTRPFEIAETDLERAKKSFFTYELKLRLRGGQGRAAIGIVDEVGKTRGFRQLALPIENRRADAIR